MGTKGETGAGIQHTARGPVQGFRPVGANGLPIDSVVDSNSVNRLAVDVGGQVTIENASINVDLDAASGDNVAIQNSSNTDQLFIQPDGTIGVRSFGIDGGGTQRQLLTNAAGRLQVDIVGGGGSAGQLVQDGQTAIPASDVGRIQAGFDGTDYQFISVNSSGRLQVDILSSALPLGAATETTLGNIQTLLDILDDWDELDRAKVNPVVGQAGLAAGSGVDVANALRVSLATDVPLPAGTNTLGAITQAVHDLLNVNANLQVANTDVAVANPVPVDLRTTNIIAQISTDNSSTTPLGISGTFTGDWESTLGAAQISVTVIADQPSATEGLVIQWSSDGVNIDDEDDYSIFANNGKKFTFGPAAPYIRLVYTNGTVAQSFFRLQTVLHPFGGKASSHRLVDDLNDNDDAELVKAVIAAKDPNNVYINLTSDASGRLAVSTQAPTVPEDTDPVVQVADGTMSANTTLDDYYTITNGLDLVIQRFNAGAVQTTGGNVVELYYDPNGSTPTPPAVGAGWILISVAFIPDSGGNYTEDLSPVTYPGDGTGRIVLRRTHQSGNGLRVFAKFSGFEA